MKKTIGLILGSIVLCGMVFAVDYPEWFTGRGVIDPSQEAHDHGPVNQGQVKWIASQAYAEFQQKLPASDLDKLLAVIDSFPAGGNHKPANLGMLKAVATPFYDELMAAGYASNYPWASGSPADYNLANQGQLKNLFAFDFDVDLDGDGLFDWWVEKYGPASSDADGDGLTNLQEYQAGTDPVNADSDGDGVSDGDEAALGTDPLETDTDGDGLSDGEEVNTFGSNPTVPAWQDGGIAGMLQVERWNEIGGMNSLCLVGSSKFGNEPDERSWVSTTEYPQNNGDYFGIRMRGTLTAPVDGTYVFWLTADYSAQVWLGDTESPFSRELILNPASYTSYRDLSSPNVRASAPITLTSNQTCYVEILLAEAIGADHVTLWWTRPGETDPEIIGSEYLHSYVQPADDLDMDGLPDAWEAANGLDPTDGTGGGYLDADDDTYCDIQEYRIGTSPQSVDADGDGLKDSDETTITFTDPLNADTDEDGTPDLVVLASINGADTYDRNSSHITTQWSTVGDSVELGQLVLWGKDKYVVYEIDNPLAGMHRITVQASWTNGIPPAEDRARMAFSVDGNPVETVEPVKADGTGTYTLYTPWLTEGTHRIKCEMLSAPSRNSSGFRLDRLDLAAIDGIDADADADGIQDWMQIRMSQGLDTDADGISDHDEVNLHGTDPLDADTDGDGLTDSDELAAGTDPLDEDSDNDGVVDGVEVHETLTNPLQGEFDGTVTVVSTLAGSQTNNAVGTWEVEGTSIVSKRRRGFVEYTLNFPEQDCYGLSINASHLWSKSSCTPVAPVDTSALQISVDGTYVGSYPLVSAEGIPADVRAFLPVLPAGEHTIRIFWENVHSRLSLKINSLGLQTLGGPDANSNGVKDWIETSIASMAGVDAMVESVVSPVCLEGDARYVPFVQIVDDASSFVAVEQSAGPRWYANLPLEQSGHTAATATFQNGALEVPISIEWVPLNLIEHNGEDLIIRQGDSVKFSTDGQPFTLNVGAESIVSTNGAPVIHTFADVGSHTVGDGTSAMTVKAIGGAFPEESPACLVGREREWTVDGFSSNVVFEVDDSVDLAEPGTTNQALRTVALRANKTNGEHVLVARLSENGPILDSARLSTFWVQNATDGYFWTVERYEDSELWEVESIVKNLPDTVDLQIKVFIAGVTLDDYTLERWITNAAYDEIGEYRFRLFHPNDTEQSVCHTFKVYQDGQFIGEAFGGGQNNIGEE